MVVSILCFDREIEWFGESTLSSLCSLHYVTVILDLIGTHCRLCMQKGHVYPDCFSLDGAAHETRGSHNRCFFWFYYSSVLEVKLSDSALSDSDVKMESVQLKPGHVRKLTR